MGRWRGPLDKRNVGRPKGAKNRSPRANSAACDLIDVVVTKRRRAKASRKPIVIDPVVSVNGEAVKLFDGDAVDFFQSVYRDESYPIGTRLLAARSAAPYERPSLHAIAALQQSQGEAPSLSVNFVAPQPRPDAPRQPQRLVTIDAEPVAKVVPLALPLQRFVRSA